MNLFKKIAFVSFFFTIFGALLMSNIFSWPHPSQHGFTLSALAEDDEDENEGEEDDDEEYKKSSSSTSKTTTTIQKTIQNVIEYKPVTKTVVVTDEAFQKDTDGDGLVDAIDPDPTRHQSEYFTDIDGDGVPNALDQHHDENDFAFYEFETDENENGIIDSYEQ